jgi:hypothetical protein
LVHKGEFVYDVNKYGKCNELSLLMNGLNLSALEKILLMLALNCVHSSDNKSGINQKHSTSIQQYRLMKHLTL